jgi:CRP/FNR family transcriptional regulator, cyclic AMP receptor protein
VRLFSQDTKVQALKGVPLFEDLSRKELAELAKVSDDLEVEEGKALTREGETGQEFFVIVDGDIEVTSKGKRVASRGGGDFVGEIALLENIPRTATVTASTALRLLVLTGPSFRRLLDAAPNVERKVLRALARRVVALSRDPALL